jgi:ferredoxin
MKVCHNDSRCASTGMCEAEAPEVFEVGEDGVLHVLVAEPPAELQEAVRRAVAACPTGALSLAE